MRILLLLLFAILIPSAALAQQAEGAAPDPLATETLEEDDWTDFEDPFATEEVQVADPLEYINRASFWLNDKLYFYLLKPTARAYRTVPAPARRSVSNFFSNLAFPVRLVNNALQLKFGAAGNELRRFALNSTVGLAGFLDPAAQHGWLASDEDFGQTLGYYGIGNGIYLVIPVLGPTTLRDGAGRVADHFLAPLPYALKDEELIALKALQTVNEVSLDEDTYEKILKQALDPYLFVRDAYVQRRQGLIRK